MDGSVIEYVCEPVRIEPAKRAVVRYVSDRERAIEGTDLVLPGGAVTVGHFWVDRPYNVYHWRDGDKTIALYVSIVDETTIEDRLISYTDLVVDVLLRTSGAIEVLDEDELPPTLEPRHRLAIAKALEACITDPRRLVSEIERETRAALA